MEAVPHLIKQIEKSGLQVIQTFDLQDTRAADTACTCPRHGKEKCDCQMIVLLVYDQECPPVSLVAQGHQGQTWFSLVESVGILNGQLAERILESMRAGVSS